MSSDINGTIIAIQGTAVSSNTPTDGEVLTYSNADGYWEPVSPPTSLPPNGSAGGDLSSTYPNPTVAKIDGASVPAAGSLTTGNVLQVSGSSALSYAAVNLAGGPNYINGILPRDNQQDQNVGGDLAGTTGAVTVIKLQGQSITSTTPTNNQTLVWINGSLDWEPTTLTVGTNVNAGGNAGGDLNGNYPNPTVAKINGTSVSVSPFANTVLVATSSSTSIWNQIIDAYVSSSAAIVGTKISPDFGSQNIITTGTLSVGGTTVTSLTDSGLGTGIVHSNSSGDFTSSSIINADISYLAAIVVSKLDAGTDGQILQTISAVPTWSTYGGDVTGSATVSVVAKINGSSVPAAGSLTTGNVLQVNGSASLTYAPISLGAGANYVSGILPRTNQQDQNLGSDLSGTTGSATVAKINATTITTAGGSLTTGQVLRVTGSSASDWGALDLSNSNAITGTLSASKQAPQSLGGDLSGTTASANVIKLRGNSVSSSAPSDGYVLTWVNANSDWEPKVLNPALTGPVTGTVRSVSSNYTVDSSGNDYFLLVDTSTTAITITLPTPTIGRVLVIKDVSGNGEPKNITLARHASEKIEGITASRKLSTNWGYWTFMSNGTDWFQVA